MAYKKLTALLEVEMESLLALTSISLCLGITLFFALPFHMPFAFNLAQAMGLGLITLLMQYKSKHNYNLYNFYRVSLLVFVASVGFFTCGVRVIVVDAPKLSHTLEKVMMKGTIVQVIDGEQGKKLMLDNLHLAGVPSSNTPKVARVSFKSDISKLRVGDRIVARATLMSPPPPTYPGGFNFAEYAYFKRIGAIGYAVGKAYKVGEGDIGTWQKYINMARQNIAQRIVDAIPKSSAAVAMALLVGDTSAISVSDMAAIRASGIAHIMAISGLHVVIIVTLIFLLTRTLLSYSYTLAVRYDLKKIAAIVSIIGSFVYLLLAGSPISAQRAFIMSAIVLIAIILDRNSNPLRAIAIAAIIILLATPESLFTASLQMSFAACLSLVAAFRYLTAKLPSGTVAKKCLSYFISTIISTLVAGAATTPFVIYHFNQFSTYSLLTNLAAIPLTNFFVMPLGFISMLLMPLHLEWATLVPMSWGIKLMLMIAHKVYALPQSAIYIPSYTPWGIGLIGLGGVMICMLGTQLKWFGVVLVCIGFVSNTSYFRGSNPDIILESSGKLFVVREGEQFYFSSRAKARFVRKTWQQRFGLTDAASIRDTKLCSDGVCKVTSGGASALIVYKAQALGSAGSAKYDLVIDLTGERLNLTGKQHIDIDFLQKNGATAIWLAPHLKILTTNATIIRR